MSNESAYKVAKDRASFWQRMMEQSVTSACAYFRRRALYWQSVAEELEPGES